MSLARLERGAWLVTMDGWDDMSEGGDGERYAQCMTCDRTYALPEVEAAYQ